MNENIHDNYPDSNEKIEVPTMKVIPLKKICMTIGELPTSYLETMTYYEMLIWFINFLRDNIIPTVNENGEAVKELQNVVMKLQNYINEFKDSIDSDVEELEEYMNNYFENLDIQDEVNQALDELVESGTMDEIFSQYVHKLNWFHVTTSNTQAEIQTMLDTPGAKVVEFEKGDYTFTTYFELNANTKIILNNSVIEFTSLHGFYNFKGTDEFLEYNGNGNITIMNGTIKGGDISFCHAKNVLIKNIQFLDILNDHVLEIASCNNYTVDNCYFEGVEVQSSSRNYVECIQIDDMTNGNFPWFDSSDNPTYDRTPNKLITIKNCHFETNPDKEETNLVYTAIGGHTAQSSSFHKDIIIDNCIFRRWNYSAIRIFTLENVIVSNCVFENTYLYDEAENPTNYINKDFFSINNGIHGLKIYNNRFYGSGRIYFNSSLTDAKDIEITNNYFENNNWCYTIDQDEHKVMPTTHTSLYIISITGAKGIINVKDNVFENCQKIILRVNQNSTYESEVSFVNNQGHMNKMCAIVHLYPIANITIANNNFTTDSFYNADYGSLGQEVRKIIRIGAVVKQPYVVCNNVIPDPTGTNITKIEFQRTDYRNFKYVTNLSMFLSDVNNLSSSDEFTLSSTSHMTDYKYLILQVKASNKISTIKLNKTVESDYLTTGTFYGSVNIDGTVVSVVFTILSDNTCSFSVTNGVLTQIRGINF